MSLCILQDKKEFPYVSTPFFEAYAKDARSRASADWALYSPLTFDVDGWKNFSLANEDWIDDSLAIFSKIAPKSDLPVGAPVEPNDGAIRMWDPAGNIIPSSSIQGPFLPVLYYSPPLIELGKVQNLDL